MRRRPGTGSRLRVVPCTITDARVFVGCHHRHNKPPQSGLFAAAVAVDGEIAGVVIAGRPVARELQDGGTIEVTRVCTTEHKNAASMLYGAICRAARALGYWRAVTYTLLSEPGTSLLASGWVRDGVVPARDWDTPSRRRRTHNLFGEPTIPPEPKQRWVRILGNRPPELGSSKSSPVGRAA